MMEVLGTLAIVVGGLAGSFGGVMYMRYLEAYETAWHEYPSPWRQFGKALDWASRKGAE